MPLDTFDHLTGSVHVKTDSRSTMVNVLRDCNFDLQVCEALPDDKFIAVTVIEQKSDLFGRHELTLYLPWALCDLIHDAYEHELAGLAHEAGR